MEDTEVTDLNQTFARVIANARQLSGLTAAEFDYSLASGRYGLDSAAGQRPVRP